jgi:PTH1 family peptidyl-tRNA hydrolase
LKLLVGLGNPGKQYQKTRHNVGFMVIDHFLMIEKNQVQSKEKFLGEVGVFRHQDETYIILKPSTYMNQSGQAIRQVMNYYQIEMKDVLIFVDDIYIELGELRLREKGGHGGQNGIKSIIEQLQDQSFKRVRIGIGQDTKIPLDQYVLSNFKKSEENIIEDIKNKCAIIMTKFIQNESFVDIMTQFNKKNRG